MPNFFLIIIKNFYAYNKKNYLEIKLILSSTRNIHEILGKTLVKFAVQCANKIGIIICILNAELESPKCRAFQI